MTDFRIPSVAAFAASALAFVALPAMARAQPGCGALPAPSGVVIDVTPSQVNSLQSIIDAARPGETIQLSDGVYPLPQTLAFHTPGVTLRSKSGNRLGVVLDGQYAIGDVLLLQRSDITIADLTLTRSNWHLVHVVPDGGSSSGTTLHNLRGVDGGEQFIKVNAAGDGQYADNGVVRCSSLEMTDAGRTYVRNNCYTGGIDILHTRGWQISANVLSGFWCSSGLSGPAILSWTGSRDTIVDRNVIVNSARGIGLGLGASMEGRTYGDSPCGAVSNIGHYGGRVTNNFVVATDERLFASAAGFDTGIGLEQSCETTVVHNTVVSTTAPHSSSIEWRFANTTALVANNLVTHALLPRDGGRASLAGNLVNAPLSLFVDVAGGNLHLLPGASAAIGTGAVLTPPLPSDIDGDTRDAAPDVGADEYRAPSAVGAAKKPSPLPAHQLR